MKLLVKKKKEKINLTLLKNKLFGICFLDYLFHF